MNNESDNPTVLQTPNTDNVKSKSKWPTLILLMLLSVVTGFAAAYFWQESQKDSVNAKLSVASNEIGQLRKEIRENSKIVETRTEEPVPLKEESEESPILIPGNTDTRRNDGRILITPAFKYSPGFSAVWIEYGTDPSNINKETVKQTKTLGMGDPNSVYSHGYSVSINDSELSPGTIYYYRAAATIDGKKIHSAVASFITDK